MHARPTEVALLTALQYAPVILITPVRRGLARPPPAQVCDLRDEPDRVRPDRADLLSYLTDLLSLGLLYAVTFSSAC